MNKGDIVVLKSGGPEMTIKRIIGDENSNTKEKQSDKLLLLNGYDIGDLLCEWFDKNELKSNIFKQNSLKLK